MLDSQLVSARSTTCDSNKYIVKTVVNGRVVAIFWTDWIINFILKCWLLASSYHVLVKIVIKLVKCFVRCGCEKSIVEYSRSRSVAAVLRARCSDADARFDGTSRWKTFLPRGTWPRTSVTDVANITDCVEQRKYVEQFTKLENMQ